MKTYRDASKEFEPKWRQHWDTQKIFKTPNPNEEGFDKQKPKFVVRCDPWMLAGLDCILFGGKPKGIKPH